MASLIYILPLAIWLLLIDVSGGGTPLDRLPELYPFWLVPAWWAAVLVALWLRTRVLLGGKTGRGQSTGLAWLRLTRLQNTAQGFILLGFVLGLLMTPWPDVCVNGVWRLMEAAGGEGRWTVLEVLAGAGPVYGALWACQMILYPLNTLVREQNIMRQLELGLPVRALPTFWQSALMHLRVPMLMSVVPVMLAMALNDTLDWLVPVQMNAQAGNSRPEEVAGQSGSRATDSLMAWVVLWKWAMVVIGTLLLAPVVMGWVMGLSKIRDEKLLALLSGVLKSAGGREEGGGGVKGGVRGGVRGGAVWLPLKLWPTHHLLANAAVLGVIPGTRKIVLSDLLLETFTDDQLKAVVAHEVGHVMRRHMIWLVAGLFVMTMAVGVLSELPGVVSGWGRNEGMNGGVEGGGEWVGLALQLPALGALVGGIWAVGWLMRHFELEADAYAALAISKSHTGLQGEEPNTQTGVLPASGALVVASALHRISDVTNVPMSQRTFTHGTLEGRTRHLAKLAAAMDPQWGGVGQRGPLTQFERRGRRVRLVIALAVVASMLLTWGVASV